MNNGYRISKSDDKIIIPLVVATQQVLECLDFLDGQVKKYDYTYMTNTLRKHSTVVAMHEIANSTESPEYKKSLDIVRSVSSRAIELLQTTQVKVSVLNFSDPVLSVYVNPTTIYPYIIVIASLESFVNNAIQAGISYPRSTYFQEMRVGLTALVKEMIKDRNNGTNPHTRSFRNKYSNLFEKCKASDDITSRNFPVGVGFLYGYYTIFRDANNTIDLDSLGIVITSEQMKEKLSVLL